MSVLCVVLLFNKFTLNRKLNSVQSVPITTKAVSSKPDHGEVYLIQHYVIKFVSD